MYKRHMYHYEGMTDLAAIREQAFRYNRDGNGSVLVHLHPYDDFAIDGCASQYLETYDEYHEAFEV